MLDELSVGDLRRLVRVADCGSFSAAARALGETPRHISRRIGRIEEQVGARLFHRTTRRLRATPEGETWIRAARSSLATLEQAREVLSEGPSGVVRLQLPSLMIEELVDWCGTGLLRYPKLEVELLVSDSFEDWVEAGVDLIVTIPPKTGDLVVRRQGIIQGYLAASADYLQRAGLPRTPEELAHHTCLRFYDQRSQAVWTLVDDSGRTIEVSVGGRLTSSDSRALRHAIRGGLGIGPVTAHELSRSSLVRVLPDWRMPLAELAIVIAPGRRRLARVRVVADALETIIQAKLGAQP